MVVLVEPAYVAVRPREEKFGHLRLGARKRQIAEEFSVFVAGHGMARLHDIGGTFFSHLKAHRGIHGVPYPEIIHAYGELVQPRRKVARQKCAARKSEDVDVRSHAVIRKRSVMRLEEPSGAAEGGPPVHTCDFPQKIRSEAGARALFQMQQLTSVAGAEVEHARDIRDLAGHSLAGAFEKDAEIHISDFRCAIMILNSPKKCKARKNARCGNEKCRVLILFVDSGDGAMVSLKLQREEVVLNMKAFYADRREFLKSTVWMGALAAAAGCVGSSLKLVETCGAPMQGFALKPMKRVRVAVIGVGTRGRAALRRIANLPGTEITAIADLFQDRVDGEVKWLKNARKPAPAFAIADPEGYKRICDSDKVDVIYNVTPWHLHEPIARYAMEHGKVALNEVPGALTIDECWSLVETSERTRIPCMMLENCCYGEEEMLMLNMVKQGLFGEITHGEAAYIHDQRNLQFGERYHTMDGAQNPVKAGRPGWALDFYSKYPGNHYPTHGLGPVAKYMDINRGDAFDYIVSVESKAASYRHYASSVFSDWRKDVRVKVGDINTSIIRTKLGRTVLLELDTCTPRPYSRLNLVSGTKGMAMGYPEFRVAFEDNAGDGKAHGFKSAAETDSLREKYRHPVWKAAGELAKKVGGHGGMDFIMDLRWTYCLQNGLPLDTDVYDLAAWSSMVELTRKSVSSKSRPVECEDFTRGAWRTAKGFTIDGMDLSRLPIGLKDIKRDADVDKVARQEGFIS